MPSPSPPSENRQLKMVAAAYLAARGKSQDEIKEILNVSQPEVSRLLGEARKAPYFNVRPSFSESEVPGNLLKDAKVLYPQLAIDSKLAEQIRNLDHQHGNLDSVIIFDGAYEEFFNWAAEHVIGLLRRTKVLGVMFGRTASLIADALERRGSRGLGHSRISCIPLVGEPVYMVRSTNERFSATHLSAQLANSLGGSLHREESAALLGVPAYVSRDYHKSDEVGRFVRGIPGYQSIFGSGRKIDEVDTVITSVGIIDFKSKPDKTGVFLSERIAQEHEMSKDELDKLVLGDFAGLLIAREGNEAKVEEYNAGWFGVDETSLFEIASRAKEIKRPGNIVLAVEPQKSVVLREIIPRGLVNQLVITKEIAERLTNVSMHPE